MGLAGLLLAGCGGSGTSFSPTAMTQHTSRAPSTYVPVSNYSVFFSFSGKDGSNPYAGLTPLNAHSGPFFSTTKKGGSHNFGTIFSLTTSGQEAVLHNFSGKEDGLQPTAGLTRLNGTFYGTTANGGTGCPGSFYHGCGTVYRLSSSNKEEILYKFKGGADGAFPTGLIAIGGTLYGTTYAGGEKCGCGTFFSLSPSGKHDVLYRFKGHTDSAGPNGSLLFVDGTLYGIATGGDAGCSDYPDIIPCGSVFKVTLSGEERLLHQFGYGDDGEFPSGGLVAVGGALYGATSLGGSGHCEKYIIGCGSIFKLSTSGKEQVLYSFKNKSDGENPVGPLAVAKGALYGATFNGGARCSCGILFKVTTAGGEKKMHVFEEGADGANPAANLTNLSGILYGTTAFGGAHDRGTAFALTP